MITRTACVVCDCETLNHLYTFKDVPIFMGVSDEPYGDVSDQTWVCCDNCETIQLLNLIELNELYKHSHSPGTVGATWHAHHTGFAEYIQSNIPRTLRLDVVEVGAGSKILSNIICDNMPEIHYTVIDPNAGDFDVKVIPKFLMDIDVPMAADVMIHSHTMEHFYNPIDELTKMHSLMKPTGIMFISVPLIQNMIQNGFTNGLNFEHTYSTTEQNIKLLLSRAGFVVVDMKYFNQYNVFIKAIKKSNTSPARIFENYVGGLKTTVENINKELNNRPFFLFGAHVFSQTLLNMGLYTNIISILDNDKNKQGKILYGTRIKVYSPDIIRDLTDPVVVVKAAQYTDEIVEQLLRINPTTRVIT